MEKLLLEERIPQMKKFCFCMDLQSCARNGAIFLIGLALLYIIVVGTQNEGSGKINSFSDEDIKALLNRVCNTNGFPNCVDEYYEGEDCDPSKVGSENDVVIGNNGESDDNLNAGGAGEPSTDKRKTGWIKYEGLECSIIGGGAVGIRLIKKITVANCMAECKEMDKCEGIVRKRGDPVNFGTCWLKTNVTIQKCLSDKNYTFYKTNVVPGGRYEMLTLNEAIEREKKTSEEMI